MADGCASAFVDVFLHVKLVRFRAAAVAKPLHI